MALLPKSQVLQVRLDVELLDLFTQSADARNMTVSACVRELMRQHAKSYQDHLKRLEHAESKRAGKAVSETQGISLPNVSEKAPVASPVKPEGPVARKMRLKKEAKDRRRSDDLPDDEIDYD